MRNCRLLIYAILIILFSIPSTIEVYTQAPAFRQFTDEDGLPSMTVYSIKQDTHGFLWMNTTKGICRFDGQVFKKYEISDLKGQDIPYFFMDRKGTPWFYNMAGEIFTIRNDKIERILISAPSPDMSIVSFFADTASIYITWLGKDQSTTLEYQKDRTNIITSLENSFGFFNILNNDVLAAKRKLRDYYFELHDIPSRKLLFNLSFPQNSHFNYNNEIYIVNQIAKDSLAFFTPYFSGLLNSQFKLINTIPLRKLAGENIMYLSPINNEKLFIKTAEHSLIYSIRNNAIEQETQFGTAINTIMEDNHHRRWISTTNQGLYLSFLDKVMIYNNQNSCLPSNEISCLKDDEGSLIIGHNDGTLTFLNKNTNQCRILQNTGLRRIKSILKIGTGEYIIGTDIGIYLVTMYSGINHSIRRLKESSVKDLLLLDKSELLVLTSNGTYSQYHDDLYSGRATFSDSQLLISFRSTSACTYKDTVIVGTAKGMYYRKGLQFMKWHLLSDRQLYINKLYSFDQKILWICTDGNGAYAYRHGLITDSVNIKKGLPSNSISCITAIDSNRFIFGTDNGAFIYDLKTKNGFGFNQLDGLPAKEVLDLSSAQDMIWFATAKGLAAVSKNQLLANREKPHVSVSNVIAYSNGKEIPFTGELAYHSNHLKFKLTTRSLLSSDQLKIHYSLNAPDTNWIVTHNDFLEFVGLAPGNYHLIVKAYNEDGVSSENMVSIPFTIHPPWWKTLWFNSLLICCLVGGGIGITYWKQRIKRKEENRKRKIVEQMNQLRQQALQNQMNPHFIFNALNAIQNFLLLNDEVKAVNYLSRFGKLIRMIFEQSKMKTISLEDEITFLSHYIHLEELRFGNKVQVSFEVDPELQENATEVSIPPLLIQPIIENAFRHGLFHLEKKGMLSIRITRYNYGICCIVEDNGVGREKTRKINEWKKRNHKSSGIQSTMERLEILDEGRNQLGLEIIDLFDGEGNPSGTKVILKL